MSNQEKVDAITAAIGLGADKLVAAAAGISADIAALKAANQQIDFTTLEAKAAIITSVADALAALDDENPPATP